MDTTSYCGKPELCRTSLMDSSLFLVPKNSPVLLQEHYESNLDRYIAYYLQVRYQIGVSITDFQKQNAALVGNRAC